MVGSQDDPQFTAPGEGQGTGSATGGDGEFEAPSEDALGLEIDDQEAQAFAAELPEDLVALKSELEGKLATSAVAAADVAALGAETGNINGVGFAMADAEDIASGLAENVAPGQPALVVFTVERQDSSTLSAEIASAAGTRALTAAPVIQAPVGSIDAQPHRFWIRPAPGGVSVGHFRITAGTLGCLSIGLRPPRSSRLMVLSNNHVLANSNSARLGDCITQPGPYDGGRCPTHQIAILERFIPINFSGAVNYVDCATGWAWPDRVRRELIYLSGGQRRFFRIGSAPVSPQVGMLVGKTGRTTQLTQGRVTAVNVAINVNFGGGKVAHFRDQFAVRAASGNFSAGGDSGSVIWQWASGLRPVGLLFAGGGGTTFANRMTRVLAALDIRLYT
ncbi:MAG: hypothetical protein EA405_12500 [Rhodospirillales bacterium]|nr:MAG: hypothetical protein EA405_12500 [Rhodospirillales bacterium]